MAGLEGRLGQAGPEQRGFWSVGSRQPSAASSGARREDSLEVPSLCLPFCHAPQSSGPAPPPQPHRWGCLGRGQLFASEGMAGGGCFWAPMRGWQQNGKGFSAPPSPTQVFAAPQVPRGFPEDSVLPGTSGARAPVMPEQVPPHLALAFSPGRAGWAGTPAGNSTRPHVDAYKARSRCLIQSLIHSRNTGQ